MSFKNPIYDDITYLKGVGPKRAEELRQETVVGGFEDFTIPGTNFVVTKKDN